MRADVHPKRISFHRHVMRWQIIIINIIIIIIVIIIPSLFFIIHIICTETVYKKTVNTFNRSGPSQYAFHTGICLYNTVLCLGIDKKQSIVIILGIEI